MNIQKNIFLFIIMPLTTFNVICPDENKNTVMDFNSVAVLENTNTSEKQIELITNLKLKNDADLNQKIKIDLSNVFVDLFDECQYSPNQFKDQATNILLDKLIEQDLPLCQKEALLIFRHIRTLNLELKDKAIASSKGVRKQIYKELRCNHKKLHRLKKQAKKQPIIFARENLAKLYEITPDLATFLPQIGIGTHAKAFKRFRVNGNPFNKIDWKRTVKKLIWMQVDAFVYASVISYAALIAGSIIKLTFLKVAYAIS